MKTKKYFLSFLSTLFLLFFTQGASAYMLFNYQTAEMNWTTEQAYLQDGNPVYIGDYFSYYSFQFDVTFMTPDIDLDLEELEVVAMEFDNPVTSVNSSGLFQTISIERSSFWLEAFKVEGNIYTDWMLTFDIVADDFPVDTVLTASVTSRGMWDYMALDVDN